MLFGINQLIFLLLYLNENIDKDHNKKMFVNTNQMSEFPFAKKKKHFFIEKHQSNCTNFNKSPLSTT